MDLAGLSKCLCRQRWFCTLRSRSAGINQQGVKEHLRIHLHQLINGLAAFGVDDIFVALKLLRSITVCWSNRFDTRRKRASQCK